MTKVDIISGFLGAGKTTFIKKLIEDVFPGERLVLIENEFGEIGIDGGFLKDAGVEITEMNSGCICCTLVGDFSKERPPMAQLQGAAALTRELMKKYHISLENVKPHRAVTAGTDCPGAAFPWQEFIERVAADVR